MKIAFASLVLAGFAGACLAQEPAPRPAEKPVTGDGQEPAPEKAERKHLELGMRLPGTFSLKDIDGKAHKAQSYMGKIVVLNFYSIQCPIQAAWDPALSKIQRDYQDKGIVFLHVNSNVSEIGRSEPTEKVDALPYDNLRVHLKKKDLPYKVLVDHGNVLADFMQAQTTPHVFVFGNDGRLVYRGLVDDDQRGTKGADAKRYLKDTLDQLLAGERPEPFETTPRGCSIKRVPNGKDGDGKGGRPRGRGRGNDGGK